MLTKERADILTEILKADEARAQMFLSLEANEALKQINALGNDFTLEELHEYGESLQAASTQGELSADALDDVAGGFVFDVRTLFPWSNPWSKKLPYGTCS